MRVEWERSIGEREEERREGWEAQIFSPWIPWRISFKCPQPCSSPSTWSTILKVISCYPETLRWLELLASSSSTVSMLSFPDSPSPFYLSISLCLRSLCIPFPLQDLGSALQRVTNTTRINVICWGLLSLLISLREQYLTC